MPMSGVSPALALGYAHSRTTEPEWRYEQSCGQEARDPRR